MRVSRLFFIYGKDLGTMQTPQNVMVLSRYFYDNVNFVSNMCPKCYEECTEVRIIGINLRFLKNINSNFYEQFEDLLLGFTEEQIQDSCNAYQNYLKCKTQTESLRNEPILKISTIKSKEEWLLEYAIDSVNESADTYKTAIYLNKSVDVNNNKNKYKARKKVQYEVYEKQHLTRTNVIRYVQKNKRKLYKNIIGKQFKNASSELESNNPPNNNIILENKMSPECETNYFLHEINSQTNPKLQRTQFVSNFLISDFELEYYQNTKIMNTSWNPPSSPHNLVEENLYHDPWSLLVATIFLNKTTCLAARPYVFWFLSENPDPLTLLDKFPSDLEKYFATLGLRKTRAVQIYRMSHDFLFKKWTCVRQLYGIGDYGECAYRMFCLGDFSVEPKDRFLKIYKAWYQKFYEKIDDS